MKIGTDIIQIARIEKLIQNYGDTFKKKYLSEDEIQRTKTIASLAGLWAAKEAIAKALGCGICADLTFQDIIIYKNHRGAPYFRLTPKAQKIHMITHSSLSMSHDGGFAIAVVAINTA